MSVISSASTCSSVLRASGSESATVTVGLGDEARGQLIIDRRHNAAPPNVRLVRDADEVRFKDTLIEVTHLNTGSAYAYSYDYGAKPEPEPKRIGVGDLLRRSGRGR